MNRKELMSKSKKELLEMAKKLDVPGRSLMSKEDLVGALSKRMLRRAKPKTAARRETKRKPARPKAKKARAKAGAKIKPRVARGRKAKPATRKPRPRVRAAAKPARKVARRKAARPVEAPRAPAPPAYYAPPEKEKPRPVVEPGPVGAPAVMQDTYGQDYAALMIRDPHWLFAYWEVTPEATDRARRELEREWEGHRWVLRVYMAEATDRGPGEESHNDIELPAGAFSWYLHVKHAEWVYRFEVGVRTRSGRFYRLVRSNSVRTPRDDYSPVTDETWMGLPEPLRRLHQEWARMELEGRSSAELGALLRERLRSDWSSGLPTRMGSEGLVKHEVEERGFWFILGADLVVYGATEPHASVAIQGHPVQLKPDGTFSLRFQLPDGTQRIDAVAVSADGTFRRKIEAVVNKETQSDENGES